VGVILPSCGSVQDPHHVDEDPDPGVFYADPDLFLMQMWIRLFTLMMIQILPSK
jgi:hypothetical protein